MTTTLGQIVLPLEIWFAVRGVISTVPVWLLVTAFYSWTAPLTTAIHVNDAGSDSIGSHHADHANAMDGEDMERSATAATIGKDDDAMDLESIIANSLSIENDDLLLVNDEEDNNCVEVEGVDKEDMECNPMGLQLWQNGKISREGSCMIYSIMTYSFSLLSYLRAMHHHRFAQKIDRGITLSCFGWWPTYPCYPCSTLVQNGCGSNK